MAESQIASLPPPPRKRRVWPRVIAWVLGIFILLIIVVYFVATSSAFLKGQILPRVSKSLNADVTVSDASIHPFSEVVLHNLKVQPTNQPPIITAPEVRVRYSLFDIIGGNIHVDEMALVSPTIQLVQNPDGSSNLDPLTKSQKPSEKKPKPLSKPSKQTKIDIRRVTITDATVLKVQNHTGGTRDLLELTNVNLTVTDVKNGEAGKLELKAIIHEENNPPAPAMYGLLTATVNGSFNFALTPDLKPGSILGDTKVEISNASGSFSDFATLSANLHCDMSPTEIKDASLKFQKGGNALGELRASGPFDTAKSEGKLTVVLLSLDKQVLNLFGAKSGIDFGSTTINSTNTIDISKSGSVVAAVGELTLGKLQLTRTNQTTPTLDVRVAYDASVDSNQKTALLRTFNLDGAQDGRPLLHGELTSPMTLAWGNTTNSVGDSSLTLTVTKLNLADWKSFAGNGVPSGIVNVNLKLLSQQSGKQLTFDAGSQIENLAMQLGSNQIAGATVTLQAHGQAADLKQFNLTNYSLQLAQSNQPALTISGSGTYDTATSSADMQLTLQATLARLLQLLGRTDVAASSGTVDLKAHVLQKQQAQTVTGNLALANFTGKFGSNQFNNFGTTMDLDIAKGSEQIDIHKVAGKLTQDGNVGGSFDVSGTYGLTNKPTQLTVKLADFNQNGLRPFLEPMLTGKKLVSISVNGNVAVQLNPNGDSAVKADLQVTNLVVNDPTQQIPATPLEARLNIDTSVANKTADLRQLQITLTPTQRGKNQLQLQGRVNFAQTNAMQGNLKLTADSIDVTSYYDLFAGKKEEAKKAKQAATPQPENAPASPAPSGPPQEPAGKQLPFKNFVVDANVREFYLREIAITNLQTTIKLDGGRVLMNPFQLALNGSPVTATIDADLSVPGYKYALTFNADHVPFAPLWNTFKPEEKGKLGGTLTAMANISGTGTTGESLKKTLNGKFDIGTTNLNLSVANVKSPILRTIINVVATIPELLRNPEGAVGSLLGTVTGNVLGTGGGLTDELSKSPIDVITARGGAGDGRVDLQEMVIRSAAFEANAKGAVTLENVLTNSTINIPVAISLRRGVAERINAVPANTPTNADYVKLPDFLSLAGTVGKPKANINKLALGGQVLKGFVPSFGGGGSTNGGSGSLLQGIGGLLNRGTTPSTNTNTATNAPPATNEPPINNFLNSILGPRRK